jgi:hypothetical protein
MRASDVFVLRMYSRVPKYGFTPVPFVNEFGLEDADA